MKKLFRKAISILLVAVMVLCAAPLAGLVGIELPEINLFGSKAEAAVSGECGENLEWEFYDSTGELIISGTGEMTNWSSYRSIPWYDYRLSIKSITIYAGVESIGDNAFYYCLNLKDITIGKDIKRIGNGVFTDCSKLERITVDSANTVYSSDEGVLFDKNKTVLIQYPIGNTRTSYAIPDSVKNIDKYAFQSCGKLESLTVPYGVTSISERAFSQCSKLKSVTIPDSVTSIGDYAFYFCSALESVTISNRLTSISNSLFNYCTNLKSISIPNGVTSIDKSAFCYCFELTSVTIPKSVKTIGTDAFNYASKIFDVYYGGMREDWDSISFGEGNGFLTRKENNFHFNYVVPEEPLTTVPLTTAPTTTRPTTTVPATTRPAETTTRPTTTAPTTTKPATTDPSATATGKCGENLTWAFYESTGELVISGTGDMYDWTSYNSVPWWYIYSIYIHSVVIIEEVTSIGDCAFMYCGSIENVIMPNSLSIIGNSAFEGCYDLKSITIPDGVISIGNSAFDGCDSLTSVTIPDRVTSIGDNAFNYCTELRSITVPASLKTVGTYAFDFCPELTDVYYKGTEEEWDRIVIGERNSDLIYATIHFNYDPEAPTTTRPTTTTTTTKPTTTTTRPITTTTKPTTTKPSTTKPVTPPVTESAATVQILQPSQTTIKYGDSIILHVRIEGGIPQGAKVEWTVNSLCFNCDVSDDGMTCKISPFLSGDTTFTVTVVDADGKVISTDEQVMTSKAGLFDKIIGFFKKLFGLTKTIPQIYKGIY